jgi:hypothetical protein
MFVFEFLQKLPQKIYQNDEIFCEHIFKKI